LIVKKSPVESHAKQGDFIRQLLFLSVRPILFFYVKKGLKAISRFSFQDSVDADAFHRGG
jgi:hypothetical protein